MTPSTKAEFFLNFQQFGDLKLQARSDTDDAAVAVAQQFEGLFVQQMLSAMRAAAKVDDNQHSSYMDFYQETYDKQLAQTIAAQDRLGIARMILEQMPDQQVVAALDEATAAESVLPPVATAIALPTLSVTSSQLPENPEIKAMPATKVESDDRDSANVVVSAVSDSDFAEVDEIERANQRWQSPQDFVADLLPQAESAAKQLGVSAQLLVAQAALETGWGRHSMKLDDGRNSFNLFGIKAGNGWDGNTLHRQSLEYEQGVLVNRGSNFRSYHSPAQSLEDYANFIQSNPRYGAALEVSGDDHAYIREIQRAGYATDPQYAQKIINILNGTPMQDALASLNTEAINHA